jgi:hypothetical protein
MWVDGRAEKIGCRRGTRGEEVGRGGEETWDNMPWERLAE